MKLNQSPFASTPSIPYPVVPSGDNWIYFAKQGAVNPNIMPISLQEQQNKQVMMGLLLLDAAEALAAERGITPEEANSLFFNQEVNGTVVAGVSPLRYLKGELRNQYLSAARESSDLPIKVATLMIQHRMLFSVYVTEGAKPKSKQLSIAEPFFDLAVGATLKIDGQLVKVTEAYDPESGLIEVTPLSKAVAAGSVGFLMQADGKRFVMGDSEWTEEQTYSLSIENADGSSSQIDRIYQFYLEESGRAPIATESVDEGNEPLQSGEKNLTESLNQSTLTGADSTGESNLTELQTNGSMPTTSELALAG